MKAFKRWSIISKAGQRTWKHNQNAAKKSIFFTFFLKKRFRVYYHPVEILQDNIFAVKKPKHFIRLFDRRFENVFNNEFNEISETRGRKLFLRFTPWKISPQIAVRVDFFCIIRKAIVLFRSIIIWICCLFVFARLFRYEEIWILWYWAWKIRHHKNVEMHEIYYYYGNINIHTDMEQIKTKKILSSCLGEKIKTRHHEGKTFSHSDEEFFFVKNLFILINLHLEGIKTFSCDVASIISLWAKFWCCSCKHFFSPFFIVIG